jgi:hypothetical protein
MTKVFLVNDTDHEGPCLFVASTYHRAWKWIKIRQQEDILRREKQGWTKKQLKVSKQYFEDPKELHPYTIDEMEMNKY